ncbi:mucin-2-like isoform X1 [Mobula hypostoma]|uniref:mucin-2-like isoform X1 n=2 Tax=Mobula hypostoma TaxID=723540 RepID=UPI002FC32474
METVERWKMCLCLFVAVIFTSLVNSTEEPFDSMERTPSSTTLLFNLLSSTKGLVKPTEQPTSSNISHDTDLDVTGHSSAPSLKNGTGFIAPLENSTVRALTHNAEMSELTQKNEMAPSVTDGAPLAGNETQIGISKPTVGPIDTSSLNTDTVNVTVGPNVTERHSQTMIAGSSVEVTTIPQQMGTTRKMDATVEESRYETTIEPKKNSPTTPTGHEGSKELANYTLAESEAPQVLSTLQESKTTPTTVTSSTPAGISTTTETKPTSHPSTTQATGVVTSQTVINKATTLFSTQQDEDSMANAKKMVNEKPDSNLSQNKMDPLVIGMITVFFIIIGIVSLLGYLKYRQRINQPEFRRLHELPMDDMMEEDTPLSLYSY